jgi:hypothetical protein
MDLKSNKPTKKNKPSIGGKGIFGKNVTYQIKNVSPIYEIPTPLYVTN